MPVVSPARLSEIAGEVGFARAEHAIREAYSMWSWGGMVDVLQRATMTQMEKEPELATVFLFHGSGYLREAALDLLDGPLDQPILCYGVAQRLNDWVPAVRVAAKAAMARCYPETATGTLAPAVWALMLNAAGWQRWGDGYTQFMGQVLSRQGLVAVLIEDCLRAFPGSGRIFRALGQSPHVDLMLDQVARAAREPYLRAMAVECIAEGQVWWPTGGKVKRWLDRSMGHYRLDPELDHRPLTVSVDLATFLKKALADPAAVVRRRAMDALIQHRDRTDLSSLVGEVLSRTTTDPDTGVTRRLDYLRKIMPADL